MLRQDTVHVNMCIVRPAHHARRTRRRRQLAALVMLRARATLYADALNAERARPRVDRDRARGRAARHPARSISRQLRSMPRALARGRRTERARARAASRSLYIASWLLELFAWR